MSTVIKSKKKWIILSSCFIFLVIACVTCDYVTGIQNITNVTIELVSDNVTSAEKVIMTEEDMMKVKNILENRGPSYDSGFVFAPGGYRLVVEMERGTVNLYPYCGETWCFMIGEYGKQYLDLDDKNAEELKTILNQYFNVKDYSGDCDGYWSNLDS